MGMIRKVKTFKANVDWLSTLIGGKPKAARYLLAARKKPSLLAEGRFAHLPIVFRRMDINSVRKILIEQKYAFLRPYIANNSLMRVMDIGAHIGTFSLWCLAENAQCDIYSVEADPDTFAVLKRNREPAAQYGHAWRVLNRAAWKEEAVVPFAKPAPKVKKGKQPVKSEIRLLGVALEKLFELSKYERVDLLRVDIEGAEEAFLTAKPKILEKVEMVLVTINPKRCNEQNIRTLLSQHFQVIEDIGPRKTSKPMVFCRKYG